MTAPLHYIELVARELSGMSLSGSKSSEVARLTLEVVAELRETRDQLDSHHAYISGLTNRKSCPICLHEQAEEVSA